MKKNRFSQFFFRGVSGKTALFVLSIIVVIHILVMYLYVQDTRIARRTATRDELIQKIINTIHLAQATPALNRSHAVSAIEDPDLHVSVTETPRWKLQFEQISFWDISLALRNNLDSFAISIKLDKTQWLNINASIYSHIVLTQLLLISLELLVFGAILFAAWSINRFTQPLKRFKNAADRLGVDLDTKPISIYGPPIVKDTANAMNLMQERIKDLIRDRTQMLAAISHDLRTPITRMKLRSQFVESEELKIKFNQDLDEMESMIAQTLSFAREDSIKEESTSLDLVALLFAICDEMMELNQPVTFESEAHQLLCHGKPIALKRAFNNIINNAIRYGKKADVAITTHDRLAAITITDEGPGVPENDIPKLFAPFYRGESSRSRETGGVGLGLAVTNDIIRAHRGKLIFVNRKPRGLSVTIELPIENKG